MVDLVEFAKQQKAVAVYARNLMLAAMTFCLFLAGVIFVLDNETWPMAVALAVFFLAMAFANQRLVRKYSKAGI